MCLPHSPNCNLEKKTVLIHTNVREKCYTNENIMQITILWRKLQKVRQLVKKQIYSIENNVIMQNLNNLHFLGVLN